MTVSENLVPVSNEDLLRNLREEKVPRRHHSVKNTKERENLSKKGRLFKKKHHRKHRKKKKLIKGKKKGSKTHSKIKRKEANEVQSIIKSKKKCLIT